MGTKGNKIGKEWCALIISQYLSIDGLIVSSFKEQRLVGSECVRVEQNIYPRTVVSVS
jgi:hypothetical protein